MSQDSALERLAATAERAPIRPGVKAPVVGALRKPVSPACDNQSSNLASKGHIPVRIPGVVRLTVLVAVYSSVGRHIVRSRRCCSGLSSPVPCLHLCDQTESLCSISRLAVDCEPVLLKNLGPAAEEFPRLLVVRDVPPRRMFEMNPTGEWPNVVDFTW